MKPCMKGCPGRAVLAAFGFYIIAFFPGAAQDAFAEGRLGVGLRAGPAVLTQDIADSVEGNLGPIVSGNVFYALSDAVLFGLNVEWETHSVDVSGNDLGDSTTVSLIPFVELHGSGMASVSPYVSLGVGVNLNYFDLSDTGSAIFSKFDPPTTVALKIAGGADYFLTKNVALNAEVGWKYNSGDVDVCAGIIGCGTDDWNVSIFSALFGFRYFF